MKLSCVSILPLLLSTVYASTLVTISNETFQDRGASFGPKVPINGKIGFIIEPPSDPTGCSIVEAPISSDWIALVRRGGCSFITKTRHMQMSGAVAVIVGDPENPGWVTMYAPVDTSDVTIPSVFLARNNYKKVLHLSKLLGTPLMAILQQDSYDNFNVLSWPFIDMIVIIILSPCVMVFLIYVSWILKQRALRRQELAPLSVVSQLTIKIFNEPKKEKMNLSEKKGLLTEEDEEDSDEEEGEICAICLEEYQSGNELRLLPCNHQFHASCVDAWLTTQKKLCPICKRDITCSNSNNNTPLRLESQAL